MNTEHQTLARPWRHALAHAGVWGRALRIGLPVGLVQIAINQGDHWITLTLTTGVILKTALTPMISTGIAFASAASMHLADAKSAPASSNF
jgi:hypothetical protein